MDLQQLSMMTGRVVPIFSLLVPFWIVWAMSGFRGMLGVWPVALVAGAAFAIPQFLVSNFHGPWLPDIVASGSSMVAVLLLLRFWKPRQPINASGEKTESGTTSNHHRIEIARAWLPWLVLSLLVFVWGLPGFKKIADGTSAVINAPSILQLPTTLTVIKIPILALNEVVVRMPPVAPENSLPEKAIFILNWLSATGTGILVSAILVALLILRCSIKEMANAYWATIMQVRLSLITISAMLAIG